MGSAILFESSGGQVDRRATLPDLRFAIGDPEVETTSVDQAAHTLERRSFYIRKVGDGYQIHHKATLRKVVSDKRQSLDEETEVRPTIEALVKAEFERGRSVPLVCFPPDGSEVPDDPKLAIVVASPSQEWAGKPDQRAQVLEWIRKRGPSDRLYPAAPLWCFKKLGRELRDKVEIFLAWRRVKRDLDEGLLGGDYDKSDLGELQASLKSAEDAAKDEVWAGYRFVVLSDTHEADGLKVIDLGAGHASSGETLVGRIIAALKSQALLNESVGAGYIERNWPEALKASGAWPLSGLRQSFLNGALARLVDPDAVLQRRVVDFVTNGDFGLASGQRPDGSYERVWFEELVAPDEVAFDPGVFMLTKAKALALKAREGLPPPPPPPPPTPQPPEREKPAAGTRELRVTGTVPPEVWNRIGTKLVPKLRSGSQLSIEVGFTVKVEARVAQVLVNDLRQILDELGLADRLTISDTGEAG